MNLYCPYEAGARHSVEAEGGCRNKITSEKSGRTLLAMALFVTFCHRLPGARAELNEGFEQENAELTEDRTEVDADSGAAQPRQALSAQTRRVHGSDFQRANAPGAAEPKVYRILPF